MREFFRGWRRKSGCITLGLALALMGMWVRSRIFEDKMIWVWRGTAHLLNSEDGGISWTAYIGPSNTRELFWYGSSPIKNDSHHGWWQAKEECETQWEFQFSGFSFGTATKGSFNQLAKYWLIPYWILVFPLTLLSACLLLWKPRKRATTNA